MTGHALPEDSGALAAPGLSLMPGGAAGLRGRVASALGSMLAAVAVDALAGCVTGADGRPADGGPAVLAAMWEAALAAVRLGRDLPSVWLRGVRLAVLAAARRPAGRLGARPARPVRIPGCPGMLAGAEATCAP